MKTIRKCPCCGSTRITSFIVSEQGKKYLKIGCKKCGYCNKREIGTKS